MGNPATQTTMRAELHFKQFRTYASTEAEFEQQYEEDLKELLRQFIVEVFDRVPTALTITGLGFEDKTRISTTTKSGGRKGFTQKQLNRTGEVTIKRVLQNGKYFIQFSDNNGTFKRLRWSPNRRSVSEWRNLYKQAQNTLTTTRTLPDTVRDEYITVIEPSDGRELWTETETYRHQT